MDIPALIFSGVSGVRGISASGNTLTLYFACGASFRTETRNFRYPLLHAKADMLPDAEMLSGSNALNFLSFFPDEAALDAAIGQLKDRAVPYYKWRDAAGAAFFDQKIRLYQDLPFHDLRRLQLDFAVREGIFTAELGDTSSWRASVANASAKAFLEELTRVVSLRDPDVIEGMELSSRVLPELAALAKKEKIQLAFGRGGTPLASRRSRFVTDGRQQNVLVFTAPGREFVDLTHLAIFHDAVYRDFEAFDLDYLAGYFRLAGSRTEMMRQLGDMWLPSYFYQTQLLPMSLQSVILRGNGSSLDALFVDAYGTMRASVPLPEMPQFFEGALTRSDAAGVFFDVLHCDVRSLYPSILLAEKRAPRRDEKNLILSLLGELRRFRLAAKDRARNAADLVEKREADAVQSAFKILINSFYGYLGFAQGSFNDYALAARVTERGREIMRNMLDFLGERNCRVIELDTDGIYFQLPQGVSAPEIETALRQSLPPGIEVEFDGDYRAMFSYKSKNYALLDNSGNMTLAGAALKSRALEPFQREFIADCVRALLAGEPQKVALLADELEKAISEHQLPLEKFAKSEVLSDSPENYRKKLDSGTGRRSAAYELALASGRKYASGDRIRFYVTGDRKKVPVVGNSRRLEDAPQVRDENVPYYLEKLAALRAMFAPFTKE
ncbi:MAG: hypothetical protein MJ033_04735 [Victivallaceae bacterium]|nr:hypothetical protein [Victivallaceae bacterium]